MDKANLKILAIDDINDNLISLKALIKEVFPEALILTALSGLIGIELAAKEDPDVILLDIVMPVMDGFEVCVKLKSDKTLSDIPVIFLTALKDDKEIRIRALESGAEAFLSKPIDQSELTAQIRAMVRIKTANLDKREEKERLKNLVEKRTMQLEKELAEHKETEEALREANELFTLFLIHSPIFTYIKEVSHNSSRVLKASENFYMMIGIPGDQMVGKTMEELFPAEFAAKITADDWSVVSTGTTINVVEELNSHYYNTLKFPIFKGGKYLLAGFTIDITERKLAEETIKEKAKELERFNSLMIGRELKMIELKEEINQLSARLGEPDKYKIANN